MPVLQGLNLLTAARARPMPESATMQRVYRPGGRIELNFVLETFSMGLEVSQGARFLKNWNVETYSRVRIRVTNST